MQTRRVDKIVEDLQKVMLHPDLHKIDEINIRWDKEGNLMDIHSEETSKDVKIRLCPYAEEIYDFNRLESMSDDSYHQACMDI